MNETPVNSWWETDPVMNRKCALCGEPVRKHIVPTAGTQLVGKTGLMCPGDARLRPSDQQEVMQTTAIGKEWPNDQSG